MDRTTSLPPPSKKDTRTAIITGCRTAIAAGGLADASLRAVADAAGVSVGSINYQIGDRDALIDAVVAAETMAVTTQRQTWTARAGGWPTGDDTCLADLIGAWLDDGADGRRDSAVVQAELLLHASRRPVHAMTPLLAAIDDLWRTILSGHPQAARLAPLIAAYCHDEQPFSILLRDDPDYRLLRNSTIRALLRSPYSPCEAAADWHMRIVGRLSVAAAGAHRADDIAPSGPRATIAGHIADVVADMGIGAVSHRSVARAAGLPVSSVAHHFAGGRDLVRGGVEALYRRMRADLGADDARPARSGSAVMRLTHDVALAALRDPDFRPFAIDMRRRRAENVHTAVAQALDPAGRADRATTQALVMAMVGHGLCQHARGREPIALPAFITALVAPHHRRE